MIKRDKTGAVVEFEDEKAVAAMTAFQPGRPGGKSSSPEGQGEADLTSEELEKIYADEVAVIMASTEAELTAYVSQATAKVAEIEKASAVAKEELRRALQLGINETNRICREAIEVLKKDKEVALAEVRKARYESLAPVQVDYGMKMAALKAKQDDAATAARERLSVGLSKLKREQVSDDKMKAVMDVALGMG